MTEPSASPRFLALGDSYTIGEGVLPVERWPVQLVDRLRRETIDVSDPEIIATTGWTTDELWEAMNRIAPVGGCGLVSLLIGVNNQYRGRPLHEYRTQFRELLERAVRLASRDARRVMVLSIPDWGVTPFAVGRDRGSIARDIDAFNAANREETNAVGARYVDTSAASRVAATDDSLLASDGLHPSGKLYAIWAELALPTTREILSR